MPYAYDVKRKMYKRLSVKAFVCFLSKNLRSDASPCVVNSNVDTGAAGSMIRSQDYFCVLFKDCHGSICAHFIQLLGNL